jgi:hypothetical protein
MEYNNTIDISNYIIHNHCYTLYKKDNIYNNIKIDYDKINGISYILYINCNKIKNDDYIINSFNKLKVKWKKIDFINRKDDIRELINIPYERAMNDEMIKHTLSHVKAINYLNNFKNCLNEYYMICKDNISFENLVLFNNDLKSIIENSPKFDILIIHKYCRITCENVYENWNDLFNKGIHFSGTSCYIISGEGVKNFIKYAKYINDLNFVFNCNKNFDVADIYIYKNLRTFIYKYNFIGILNNTKNEYYNLYDELNKNQIKEIIKCVI